MHISGRMAIFARKLLFLVFEKASKKKNTTLNENETDINVSCFVLTGLGGVDPPLPPSQIPPTLQPTLVTPV